MRTLITALTAALVAATISVAAAPAPDAHAVAAPSQFAPLTPCRVIDTRDTGAMVMPGAPLAVDFAGRCGVPDNATAVVATLTVTEPSAPGWARLSNPADDSTSTVNFEAGGTVANQTVTSPISQVTVHAPSHIIIDVTGAMVPADMRGGEGRFVAATGTRLVDTRVSGGRLPAHGEITVPLPAGVPADAAAIAVNITMVDTAGPGYLTAYPAGTPRPLASTANSDGRGQVRAAHRWLPVSSDGITIYTSGAAHLVVDYAGFFTGPTASPTTLGLYSHTGGRRVLDTRTEWSPLATRRVAAGGQVQTMGACQQDDCWDHVAVGNLTAVSASGRGWLAFTTGTSALNTEGAAPVANTFATASTGAITVYTGPAATHVIVDVYGEFSGRWVGRQPAVQSTPARDAGTLTINSDGSACARQTETILREQAWRWLSHGVSLDVSIGQVGVPARWALFGTVEPTARPTTIRMEFGCVGTGSLPSSRFVVLHEFAHVSQYWATATGEGYQFVDDMASAAHEHQADTVGSLLLAAWYGQTVPAGSYGEIDTSAAATNRAWALITATTAG